MAKKKKRLSFDEPPGSLNNAFDDLPLAGLSTGPEDSAEEVGTETAVDPGGVCLRRETAHRAGKTVVIIGDFESQHTDESITTLARMLKQHCGTGGTVKQREIHIQGEKAPEITRVLQDLGYRVRGVTTGK